MKAKQEIVNGIIGINIVITLIASWLLGHWYSGIIPAICLCCVAVVSEKLYRDLEKKHTLLKENEKIEEVLIIIKALRDCCNKIILSNDNVDDTDIKDLTQRALIGMGKLNELQCVNEEEAIDPCVTRCIGGLQVIDTVIHADKINKTLLLENMNLVLINFSMIQSKSKGLLKSYT